MATNSIQKRLNIGHEITLHLADPNIPVNTTWSGYVTPSAGYSVPPNPYKEPDNNPEFSQDNIRKSTGFDGIEPGTTTEFLRVPLDGTAENISTTYSGGGFVLDNASGLTCGFRVNASTNSIDVDVTAMVRWYIQNRGANPSERMRILGKGSYVKPTSPDVETPYGYFTDIAPPDAGQRPSESYMITAPSGAVDQTTEVVTGAGRRAMVHFYSFGETADQYPRVRATYFYGDMNNSHSYSSTRGGIRVTIDPASSKITFVIDRSDTDADRFWKLTKTSIVNNDSFTNVMLFSTATVGFGTSTGSVVLENVIETATTVTLEFGSYTNASAVVESSGPVVNQVITGLTFNTTRQLRSFFEIPRLITTQAPAAIAGPFGDQVYLDNYQNIDDGSFIYFHDGITLAGNSLPLTVNGAGTKRFKIKRAFTNGTSLRLELDTVWSTNTSTGGVLSLKTSTGLYRPKMIVSYMS